MTSTASPGGSHHQDSAQETVQPRRPLDIDCQLLGESGLLDIPAYRTAANLPPDINPAEHYLVEGWRAGFEPRNGVHINWQYPFFCSVGLDDAPSLTFLTLRAAGCPTFANRAQAEVAAAMVRASGLFDAGDYTARNDIGDLDPATHYVIIGETMGLAPSSDFDPIYYRSRYPETARARHGQLLDYIRTGRDQGRRPLSVVANLVPDRRQIDEQRETILIVTHDATRTGAPILAYNIAKRMRKKYNVVSLLLAGGEIASAFGDASDAVVGPFHREDRNPVEANYIIRYLLDSYEFSYAIINSIDSRVVLQPLAHAFVPTVALVHEFASYLSPPGEMALNVRWATEIVFSAERVAHSMRAESATAPKLKVHILPQGPSELPPESSQDERAERDAALRLVIRPPGWENAFVVLGCGTIYARKGVDLFVSCAAAVAASKPDRPIRFVWIGQRLPSNYYSRLLKQIRRSGVSDSVAIVGEVADLEPAYACADAFFLSSRLDPLPNVAIDSALRSLPIICFENCSGISDILATDAVASTGIIPEGDVHAAARLVLKLASDETLRKELGAAAHHLAQASFNMETYINALDHLGQRAIRTMQQRKEDLATIEDDGSFDVDSFTGPDADLASRDNAIRIFISEVAANGVEQQATQFYSRRPQPGFHPYVYAHQNRTVYDVTSINPLAHFIRAGKPAGPWTHEVICPFPLKDMLPENLQLRVAVHAHFHYPELFSEFLAMIEANRAPCDLLLTTNHHVKAEILANESKAYRRGTVNITVIPNRGRDIGAFLSGLAPATIEHYDIIGHLHSKRSLSLADHNIGESWRKFIWQNLIGGQYPMMDIILDRLSRDAELGLVFPDEPHLSAWDSNLALAQELARRMGMQETLPPFFDFPIGTMFWARSSALAPLFKLGLTWDDYPKEPAPYDGTILHALERLLPSVVQYAGFRYATTHVPGVTW